MQETRRGRALFQPQFSATSGKCKHKNTGLVRKHKPVSVDRQLQGELEEYFGPAELAANDAFARQAHLAIAARAMTWSLSFCASSEYSIPSSQLI
jgi:hypothetical protein